MSNRVFHPEVSLAIEEYFKKAGISQVMAAKLLNVTPQAVSLQLKQPFGKNVSSKWEKAFGFNRDFLMTGNGELIAPREPIESAQTDSGSVNNSSMHKSEGAAQKDDTSANITKDEAYYRNLDIDDFVYDAKWESTNDYMLAQEIVKAFYIQMNAIKAEIDYYKRELAKLSEEKKNLFLENATLRQLIHKYKGQY